MTKLKVGMISFAHAGHPDSYLSELMDHPNVEVIGIADENQDRVQKYIELYDIPYYVDYKELLKTDCDAVFICSKYVNHAKLTLEAARAGKHIMCEKPLGLSIEEMQNMIAVCKEQGVQLMTAFPCRFSSPVIQAKAFIDRGDLGEILAIKGTNRGIMPGDWFVDRAVSGGGAIMDHTVHVMDLMNWFLSVPVQEVYAEAGTNFYELDVEDSGMVHVKFKNGVIGVVDTSWSFCKSFPRSFDVTLNIIGTKGVLSVDALAQSNEVYRDDVMKAEWSFWGDEMDKALVHSFVDALRRGSNVPITGEDGLNSTAVALAAYESLRTKNPVKMELFYALGGK
ncbi:Gfo/Idh/MocA family protein [Sporosarcina sp. FSL K6-3457]|uniref:Gfo/Idh/MocA family protein n=1 Tax=Sporosarcina sp. FSL K6-3457 TaxID=2978204 RepID=UPI0030F53AA0